MFCGFGLGVWGLACRVLLDWWLGVYWLGSLLFWVYAVYLFGGAFWTWFFGCCDCVGLCVVRFDCLVCGLGWCVLFNSDV